MLDHIGMTDLSGYIKSSKRLIPNEADVVNVTKNGVNYFYYTHKENLQVVINEFLGIVPDDTNENQYAKEIKRQKIEVATELEGRELSAAEQTLLKVRGKFHFFQNMSDSEVLGVTRDVGMIRLDRNEVLFRQGSDGDQVFFIVRGVVSIQIAKTPTSRVEVAKLHTGAIFGEISPVTKEKRSATVVCADDNTTLLSFRLQDEIAPEMAIAYAKMYQNFTFILADKIVNQNKLIAGQK